MKIAINIDQLEAQVMRNVCSIFPLLIMNADSTLIHCSAALIHRMQQNQ